MNHKKRVLAAVAILCATVGAGTAFAAEHANLLPAGAPAWYLKINPQTCRFIHPEIDVRPGPGERYAQAEDSRDDVKLSCLTHKIDAVKAPAPQTDPCWAKVGAPPAVVEHADHGVNKPGDELGAAALSGWAIQLYECEAAENAAS